ERVLAACAHERSGRDQAVPRRWTLQARDEDAAHDSSRAPRRVRWRQAQAHLPAGRRHDAVRRRHVHVRSDPAPHLPGRVVLAIDLSQHCAVSSLVVPRADGGLRRPGRRAPHESRGGWGRQAARRSGQPGQQLPPGQAPRDAPRQRGRAHAARSQEAQADVHRSRHRVDRGGCTEQRFRRSQRLSGPMMSVQEISDRLEIDALLSRYARAIDTLDWALLDTVFTPDATVDYTATGGIRGTYPEIRTWLAQVLPHFAVRQHFVTNREIVVEGDTAPSRALLFNPMGTRTAGGGIDLFYVGGCYVDRLRRTADGWRIVERREEHGWFDRPEQR